MKRTIPLLITALGGFVLIVAFFIPATEGWGEVTAVWFDVLASIAFLLGGGNLVKVHLKKVSDRTAGWAYSAVTLLAFFVTMAVGLAKVGVPPVAEQEFYGETFAELRLNSLPSSQVFQVSGDWSGAIDRDALPDSVQRQFVVRQRPEGTQLSFQGWMRPGQIGDLKSMHPELQWQAMVETLGEQAQPPEDLRGKVNYYADHTALSFRGPMQDAERSSLLEMSDDSTWQTAVNTLYDRSRRKTSVPIASIPPEVDLPESLSDVVQLDAGEKQLSITGPMSVGLRETLQNRFPAARPLNDEGRQELLQAIEERGQPLNSEQEVAFRKAIAGLWSVEQLVLELNAAGAAQEVERSARAMLEDQQAGVQPIPLTETVGEDVSLNEQQISLLRSFAYNPDMSAEELAAQLEEAGSFTAGQAAALETFLAKNPSIGQRNRQLYLALLAKGPLTPEQREFLLADYQAEYRWKTSVGELFLAAHNVKYEWSGPYSYSGTPFWWLYEYAFKPLTATMFAMLAFYVASAAFRAFRAKNVEASLLLGTAFIILLGRTYDGVQLTAWLPESLAGLRLENLTVTIMAVFNTAGNRAIMIGIALGIASTSLKILLGVDRSYLGSKDD